MGKDHGCGLYADGVPTCWGYERSWTGLPSEPMSVVMADLNTCFIRAADGSVDCVPAYLRPPEGVFVDVASYDGHSIAVREDGALVEWMLDPAYDTGIPLDE